MQITKERVHIDFVLYTSFILPLVVTECCINIHEVEIILNNNLYFHTIVFKAE